MLTVADSVELNNQVGRPSRPNDWRGPRSVRRRVGRWGDDPYTTPLGATRPAGNSQMEDLSFAIVS